MKKINIIAALLMTVASNNLFAQKNDESRVDHLEIQKGMTRHEINIPDVLGYETLKGDFHIHTIFSDGVVWPTYRVEEAWREGLDVIAITDHIEFWDTREKWINYGDNETNSPYEVAKPRAEELGIQLIHGAEITRGNPDTGHYNALFISDSDPLRFPQTSEPEPAIEAALKQGAFIFWNHPGWVEGKTTDVTKVYDRQRKMIEKGMIHGIEVFNTSGIFPIMVQECFDNDLTMFCNTDIHGIIADSYQLEGRSTHRPMTLVLSKDNSQESIRDAFENGRTILYFDNTLVGKDEYVKAIFDASVSAKPKHKSYFGTEVWEVENTSDITYVIEAADHRMITIPANCKALVEVSEGTKELKGEVKNLFNGMTSHPTVVVRRAK